jgi:aryl-alcohol dehydrogenase-like predicted oxidoreductase
VLQSAGEGAVDGCVYVLSEQAGLSQKDHRSRDPRFQAPQLEINLRFVERLREIASGLGWSLTDLAIAWTLRRPELTCGDCGCAKSAADSADIHCGQSGPRS